jgi:5-bromo-4-chloroindolyl phosphate hydrolysis protein
MENLQKNTHVPMHKLLKNLTVQLEETKKQLEEVQKELQEVKSVQQLQITNPISEIIAETIKSN